MTNFQFEDLQKTIKPVADLVELQGKIAEKLFKTNLSCATDCLEAGVKQAEQLATSKDLSAVLESQKDFASLISGKLISVAKEQMEIINEAQNSLAGVMGSWAVAPSTPAPKASSRKAA